MFNNYVRTVHSTKYVHIKSTTVYSPGRNWDSPNPFLASECSPPPRNRGEGAHKPACGGLGGVPIPTRGIHCGTLYMYVLCGTQVHRTKLHNSNVSRYILKSNNKKVRSHLKPVFRIWVRRIRNKKKFSSSPIEHSGRPLPPPPLSTPHPEKILTEGVEPPLEDEGPANDGEDQGGGALTHRVVEDARYAHFRGLTFFSL